jgi:hypothetical protein
MSSHDEKRLGAPLGPRPTPARDTGETVCDGDGPSFLSLHRLTQGKHKPSPLMHGPNQRKAQHLEKNRRRLSILPLVIVIPLAAAAFTKRIVIAAAPVQPEALARHDASQAFHAIAGIFLVLLFLLLL